jgi:molecular chaperone DnaK (HSP70)
MPARYIVGIDLGTTNSAVATVDTRARRRAILSIAVPQLVAEGRVVERPTLPSALYRAGEHDVPAGALALPWAEDRREVVGEFARVQGARVPARLVTSAKSWLTHAGVDRTAKILPWGVPDDLPRISPVSASARILGHIRAAWDAVHPGEPLAEQEVVLTVPASFDEVARELTVEAATEAGLDALTLLEEPQAAFYAWLAEHERGWEGALAGASRILVIDVGGGTTDFTLIEARADGNTLRLERVAVGDHLLLGGDNMDIAMARRLEAGLEGRAGTLDSVRWQSLVLQCRLAKEALLGDTAPDRSAVTVQLPGRGRGVIAGTLTAQVTRADVEGLVVEGFFPLLPPDARPRAAVGVGLREWGLPFAGESEIPRHLAAFLGRHDVTIGSGDAVLYNGGVFTPAMLRARVTAVLASWAGGAPPVVLESVGLDDAVARGAAYYGLTRRGDGVRVGAGSARACYLGLGAADDPACERLLCLLARGMEEGETVRVGEPEFELLANQPVSFQLYTSSSRSGEAPGALLESERAELAALPPIRTVLRHGRKLAARVIPVHVEARRTALGTLELWCASKESAHRWRLEFQLRDAPLLAGAGSGAGTAADAAGAGSGVGTAADAAAAGVELAPARVGAELAVSPEQVAAAVGVIAAVYPPAVGGGAESGGAATQAAHADEAVHGAVRHGDAALKAAIAALPRDLEAALGAGKDAWSLVVIRALWDALWVGAPARTLTAAHEARWLNLCGFCLRPGFGYEIDAWRVRQLSPALSTGLVFRRAVQNRAEWWNLWKRIAGGLDRAHQLRLHGEIGPWLVPRPQRKAKVRVQAGGRPASQELREMWQAIGACERIDAKLKAELGEVVVADIERGKAAPQQIWALARLGAREPLYGPLNCVAGKDVVTSWVERLLALPNWPAPEATAFALVQMARVVDDRERDLDAALRDRLAERLGGLPGGGRSTLLLHESVPLDRAEQGRLLDESLPAGLRVRAATAS